ncbi:MAG: hypothetical protein OSB26_11820 [Woeseiaceae bacterium]|jgi:hypothetical protein|nr:hypothetical protein [Woeseiaceae bacterium]
MAEKPAQLWNIFMQLSSHSNRSSSQRAFKVFSLVFPGSKLYLDFYDLQGNQAGGNGYDELILNCDFHRCM